MRTWASGAATIAALLCTAGSAGAASGLKQDLGFRGERTTVPARLAVGQKLHLDVTVRNRGRAISKAPEVQFLIACRTNCDGESTRLVPDQGEPLAARQLRNLAPGGSLRVRRTVRIPRRLDAHAGRLVACAVERFDGPGKVAKERRIKDNCIVLGTTSIGRSRAMTTDVRVTYAATARAITTTGYDDIAMSAEVVMSENRWLANFTGSRWSLQQGATARVVSASWTSSDTSCLLVSTAADGRFGELRTTSAGRGLELDGVDVPGMLFTVDCRGETRIYELSLAAGRLTDANTDVGLDGGTRSYRFGAEDLRGGGDTPVSTGEAVVSLTVRRGS